MPVVFTGDEFDLAAFKVIYDAAWEKQNDGVVEDTSYIACSDEEDCGTKKRCRYGVAWRAIIKQGTGAEAKWYGQVKWCLIEDLCEETDCHNCDTPDTLYLTVSGLPEHVEKWNGPNAVTRDDTEFGSYCGWFIGTPFDTGNTENQTGITVSFGNSGGGPSKWIVDFYDSIPHTVVPGWYHHSFLQTREDDDYTSEPCLPWDAGQLIVTNCVDARPHPTYPDGCILFPNDTAVSVTISANANAPE